MKRDIPSLLHDIIQALQSIESAVAGHGLDSYERTENLPESVNWRIAVAGEAANQLLKLNPDLAIRFPELERLVAVRHRIVHGYFSVDNRQVWMIATENIPSLAQRLQSHLDEQI
jgi:uncharacterized protein with HEPN domain